MSRIYIVQDVRGERRLDAQALPLSLGGKTAGDIVMPGVPDDQRVAFIAVAEGHAYIQTADEQVQVFHNQQHLNGSHWLKSGDEVQVDNAVMSWTVQGDLVAIKTQTRQLSEQMAPVDGTAVPVLVPPGQALPEVAKSGPRQTVHRKRRWIAFAVFVLLLLVSAFVLLATPVVVDVLPAPDRQTINGLFPAVSLGERRLVLPGRYTVKASRDGYRELQTEIVVERGGSQTFTFTLEELPGHIRFRLQPAVAYRVLVDDVQVPTDEKGITEIPGGTHSLRIETNRYLPVIVQLDIAGRGQTQQFDYDLLPGWADVQILSEPGGAAVQVDGVMRGVTPLATELMAGERRLDFSLDKYKLATLQYQIKAGATIQLDNIVLVPADGRLTVTSEPAAATISVAGVFQGTTPSTLVLGSGKQHTVRLSKPGYSNVDKTVELAADEVQQLDIRLPPEYGIVFVAAQPADASLTIDGKPSGEATRRLRLTTRPHTLAFSKVGYVSQQLTVTPRAGVSKNVDIKLKTREQVMADKKAARTPPTLTSAGGQLLRLIKPTGSFRVGASRREAGRRANESPRLIQLVRPFYLSEKEVTNAQFRRFRTTHDSGSAEGAALDADGLPVVNVSWDDAARYCNWMSKKDGLPPSYREDKGKMLIITPVTTGYRLPTEAEWAYVARQLGRNERARYPWAGQYPPTGTVGNFADASIADTLANTVPDYNDGYRATAPVGSFPAQPGGFYDLGGNVAEWMNDYYAVYPGMARTPVVDPAGPASGDHHVVRDSSWRQGGIAELRLSYRDYSRGPRPDLGFRIARYAEQENK